MRGAGARPVAERDGFVLVSVLWALVLIAGLSALFVSVLGQHLRANAALLRSVVAEAASDGAIRLIAYRLAFEPTDGASALSIPTDGAWLRCRLFDDTIAVVSVQDQDGLLDLNHAPTALLQRLFERFLDGSEARRLLSALTDIRAALASTSSPGTQTSEAPRLIGTLPITTPDVLYTLAGIERDRIAEFLRYLTVYSRSDGLDPRRAPRELLPTLSGGSAAGVEARYTRMSRGRFFAITADVGDRKRGRSVRRAIVELVRRPEQPFAVLEWGTVTATPIAEEQLSNVNIKPCSGISPVT